MKCLSSDPAKSCKIPNFGSLIAMEDLLRSELIAERIRMQQFKKENNEKEKEEEMLDDLTMNYQDKKKMRMKRKLYEAFYEELKNDPNKKRKYRLEKRRDARKMIQ